MKKTKGWIITLLFFLIICIGIGYGLNQTSNNTDVEDVKRVNRMVKTALIECYSVEGFYPEEFSYLQENYALHINDEKYRINYDYQGSNVMPNVVVYRKGE